MPAGGHINVALQVFRVSHLVGQAIDDVLRPMGLDAEEFAVLSVLRVTQPVQTRELAGMLKMPAASLSTRLAKFERGGFVRARADKSGRTKLFELTPAGETKIQECGPVFVEFVRSVESQLGRRLRAVQDGLAELERVLEELAQSAAAVPSRNLS